MPLLYIAVIDLCFISDVDVPLICALKTAIYIKLIFIEKRFDQLETRQILGLWFERDLRFKTHAALISASVVTFWKETSILITQGLNPFYAVRIFDSYVKPRVT